jgi:cytochrome c553
MIASGAAVSQQELQSAMRAKPDAALGEQLFLACAACHGSDGGGSHDGSVPTIAGQHYAVIVKQLVDFRLGKRWDIRMERYSSDHVLKGAKDIAAVASFISLLPQQRNPYSGELHDLDSKNQLYAQSCAVCHGAVAEGSSKQRIPRLAGQNDQYLVRQMHYALEGRRPNLTQEHLALLARFEFADLEVVARTLSRLPPGLP